MNTDTKDISGFGISAALPTGWDAKLYKNEGRDSDAVTAPVLQAANFPLPADDGDFATGAAESMTVGDLLIVLMEYVPDSELTVGKGLFEPLGIPSEIAVDDLEPRCMPQMIPNLAAVQRFFSENGRAFCLYMVFGGYAEIIASQQRGEEAQLETARSIVKSLQISSPAAAGAEGGPRYES
jgi:hypothetical protein